MSFTQPAYALPIVLDGTETITVDMDAGAGDFVATLAAGTYYNYSIPDDGANLSFAIAVVTALNAADTGTPWAASTPSTGLSFRMQLVRTGTTPDNMASMTASSEALRKALGWAALAVTTSSEITNDTPTTDDTTIIGTYQRGYLWVPREILSSDERIPIAEVAGSITAAGRSVVDGYGEYERIRHMIEFVPGPLIYTDKAAHADFAGVQVTGMVQGDDCAPLDQFWTLCRTGADGAPPVIKYLADATALTSTEDIVIASTDWLADMDNVAEKTDDAPLLYRVTINAIESVGTSFTSTGATVGTIAEYATYILLPTNVNGLPGVPADGTVAKVTTTDAAGYYTYVATVDGYTLDMWFPGDVAARGISYLADVSANPWRISMKNGAEAPTFPTAWRGWTEGSTGSSSVTDTGDQLFFDTTTSTPNAALVSIPGSGISAGDVFLVWEAESVLNPSGEAGCVLGVYDGALAVFLTQSSSGNPGVVKFTDLTASVGNGSYTATAYDRMFAFGEFNAVTDGSRHWECWPANKGRTTGDSMFVAEHTDFNATAEVKLFLYCDAASGAQSTCNMREVHAFAIGTP